MHWVKIKDKLPPSSGMYLVVADWMGVIEKAEFDGKNRWKIPHIFEPTHWMLLPRLPEED